MRGDDDRPLLDRYPFALDTPEGQELLRVMAALYRTEKEALIFTAPFGIDPADVPPDARATHLWYELLHMLANHGELRAAVQAARDQFPKNPRAAFLDSLLLAKPAPVSAEQPLDDAPKFDDTVTRHEALLFFDDLTMPAGHIPNLVLTLNKLATLAAAVCLLRVKNPLGSFFGTAFRIGEHTLLTNHHVLFPWHAKATQVQADFGFDVDTQGATTRITSLSAAVDSIRGEEADDWAVITVRNMPPLWPVISLDPSLAPGVGDPAYILQHPGGQLKRLGYVRNTISDVDGGRVRYLTDTQPGSSGAPVLDAQGRLIALHHAGGRPVEVAGKPPVAKNEGIRISRIVAGMRELGVSA